MKPMIEHEVNWICVKCRESTKDRAASDAKAALFEDMLAVLDRVARVADTAELFVIKAGAPAEAEFVRAAVTHAISVLERANKIAEGS